MQETHDIQSTQTVTVYRVAYDFINSAHIKYTHSTLFNVSIMIISSFIYRILFSGNEIISRFFDTTSLAEITGLIFSIMVIGTLIRAVKHRFFDLFRVDKNVAFGFLAIMFSVMLITGAASIYVLTLNSLLSVIFILVMGGVILATGGSCYAYSLKVLLQKGILLEYF